MKTDVQPLTPPLTLSKLQTCEDTEVQRLLARVADLDRRVAREMVLEGALPRTCEGYARLSQFLEAEVPNGTIEHLDDSIFDAIADRQLTAYFIGIAVGVRLAKLDDPLVAPAIGGR
jgi:hypothetical protein